MTHTCHADRCDVPVPPRMLMCRAHWRKVPAKLQRAVWKFYRPGQERDKSPSAEYLLVQTLAREAVARKEGHDTAELAIRATVWRDTIRELGREVPVELRAARQQSLAL